MSSTELKPKEVMKLLRITRMTLYNYRKDGLLKARQTQTGWWVYDAKSVYQLLNGNHPRKTCIYARVSSKKQAENLEEQISLLKRFCFQKGWQIDGIYADTSSGIFFGDRKNFLALIDEVIDNKVERVVIMTSDRLCRIGIELFSHIFNKFGTEIVIMSAEKDTACDSEEYIYEIKPFNDCYLLKQKLVSKQKSKERHQS